MRKSSSTSAPTSGISTSNTIDPRSNGPAPETPGGGGWSDKAIQRVNSDKVHKSHHDPIMARSG